MRLFKYEGHRVVISPGGTDTQALQKDMGER